MVAVVIVRYGNEEVEAVKKRVRERFLLSCRARILYVCTTDTAFCFCGEVKLSTPFFSLGSGPCGLNFGGFYSGD